MTKGKYSARAANRLVQTDNELLRHKTAECESLKAELNRVEQELNTLRRQVHNEAMREGARLAAEDIARLDTELRSVTRNFADYRERVALECWNLYQEFGASLGEGADWEAYFNKYVNIFGLNNLQRADLISISSKAFRGSRDKIRNARQRSKITSIRSELYNNPGLKFDQVPKDHGR